MKRTSRPLAALSVGLVVVKGTPPLVAQDAAPQPPAAAPAAPRFKPEEIEPIVAPIKHKSPLRCGRPRNGRRAGAFGVRNDGQDRQMKQFVRDAL